MEFPEFLSEHVRGAVALSAVIAVPTAAMAFVGAHEALPSHEQPVLARIAASPPVPPPLLLRAVAPEAAIEINRSIPLSTDPNTPARPFKMSGKRESFDRATECLATAIYYEASAESLDGQRAVAQVVLNRVRHPAFVPSVCGVVYQGSTRPTGCQFSFTCDGSLRRPPSVREWSNARAIAAAALKGAVYAPVGYATHYHADYVVPYWATALTKNQVVGRHIFYRWPQSWGTAAAFRSRYAGVELDPRELRLAALTAFAQRGPLDVDQRAEAEVAPDANVELMRIIQFLADGLPTSEHPSAYEAEVRRNFSPFSQHVAVQIYRQLSARAKGFDRQAFLDVMAFYSQPPELTQQARLNPVLVSAIGGTSTLSGFRTAVRDFVIQSDLEGFRKERDRANAGVASERAAPVTCESPCKTSQSGPQQAGRT